MTKLLEEILSSSLEIHVLRTFEQFWVLERYLKMRDVPLDWIDLYLTFNMYIHIYTRQNKLRVTCMLRALV